jgi:hypothetical protein
MVSRKVSSENLVSEAGKALRDIRTSSLMKSLAASVLFRAERKRNK